MPHAAQKYAHTPATLDQATASAAQHDPLARTQIDRARKLVIPGPNTARCGAPGSRAQGDSGSHTEDIIHTDQHRQGVNEKRLIPYSAWSERRTLKWSGMPPNV